MNLIRLVPLQQLRDLLRETSPSPSEMALRLQTVERDIVLPVKAVVVGILSFNLYHTRWFTDLASYRSVVQNTVEQFFLIYLLLNIAIAAVLIYGPRISSIWTQRMIFSASFVDGLFLAALTFATGGFDSTLYWLFLGLIVRNALSLPLATPQLLLNLSLSLCYFLAGIVDVAIPFPEDIVDLDDYEMSMKNPTEPFLLRLIVLWLLTLCCYGVQVLLEKQRQAAEEARESSSRQESLHSAGRLAAKIAHQIKNPLAIINNAAYSLSRSLSDTDKGHSRQIEIIREEVARADNIITKLMGYAQLAEGKVEKLSITEELDRALSEVFPVGAKYQVDIIRHYDAQFPPLLMQRMHLTEVFVNLLLNAREAMQGRGRIELRVSRGSQDVIRVSVRDSGPGIPAEMRNRVFEPYVSTKQKGTGLGLAIVKQNLEFYGGTVELQSELGKGTVFILTFPTRTIMKLPT